MTLVELPIAGSKPSPTWQLRAQKVLNHKTQLRGQLRAAMHQAMNWQAEVQHRLSKTTVVKGKVQSSSGQQGRGGGSGGGGGGPGGYRLQVDHKDFKHFWSCSCFQDRSGKPLNIGLCSAAVISKGVWATSLSQACVACHDEWCS